MTELAGTASPATGSYPTPAPIPWDGARSGDRRKLFHPQTYAHTYAASVAGRSSWDHRQRCSDAKVDYRPLPLPNLIRHMAPAPRGNRMQR